MASGTNKSCSTYVEESTNQFNLTDVSDCAVAAAIWDLGFNLTELATWNPSLNMTRPSTNTKVHLLPHTHHQELDHFILLVDANCIVPPISLKKPCSTSPDSATSFLPQTEYTRITTLPQRAAKSSPNPHHLQQALLRQRQQPLRKFHCNLQHLKMATD